MIKLSLKKHNGLGVCKNTIGKSVNSTAAPRSFLLRLLLQRRYWNFADDCPGGADDAAAGIVTLSGDPLDASDAETDSSADRPSRCAYKPGGKSPEISA